MINSWDYLIFVASQLHYIQIQHFFERTEDKTKGLERTQAAQVHQLLSTCSSDVRYFAHFFFFCEFRDFGVADSGLAPKGTEILNIKKNCQVTGARALGQGVMLV